MDTRGMAGPGLKNDPQWYKTAVFYEALVRAFSDSNGSGSGDFSGLIDRLDYLQWLGVDCLWLPPFFASPLRDGGYDISDYNAVLPEFGTVLRTLQAAGLGAVAATLAAVPVAVWSARGGGRTARLVERAAFTGYALPGIVVALSLVFVGLRLGPLYQTTTMLVLAYVVLFLPQAVGAVRASLLQVPPNLEEAARTLGDGPTRALFRAVLPLARGGAASGAALVFLTTVKELPATLLLAPIGFDTLATRVWATTTEAFFARAAVPALLLLLVGSVPLAVLTFGVGRRRDRAP